MIKGEKLINEIPNTKEIYLLDEFLDNRRAKFYDHRNDTFFIVDLEESNLSGIINYDESNVGNLYELPIQK
ncbi:hypothetical protein HU219_12600 [Staphylococcus sp. SS35]|nr:hypothetical protein [Staphylococcus singaporensis]